MAFEAALYSAIAREMWLHYGRNGALDWHGLEPLLSGTISRAGIARPAFGPTFAKAQPAEPEASLTGESGSSPLVNTALDPHH